MRIFGFFLILVGLVIAFGYPSYHSGFTNFEIGNYTIFEKEKGYEDQTIWLAPDDMPIDITFSAMAENTELADGSQASVLVEIRNGESIERTDTVEFSARADDQSSSAANAGEMSARLEGFETSDGALYTFAFKEHDQQQVALNSITMTVTGIVIAPNNNIPTIGYALIGFGALIYLVGSRRRSKMVGNAPTGKRSKTSQIGRRVEQAAPPAEKPEKQKRKWGRTSDS